MKLFCYLFYFAFRRHLARHSANAQYEVCDDMLCRFASKIERYVWYGGKEWGEL